MGTSKVRVTFTDRDGVEWRVLEFGYGPANMPPIRYPVGTIRGLYRGFVTVAPPRRRKAVLLVKPEHVEAARILSPRELQAELDRADDWDNRR